MAEDLTFGALLRRFRVAADLTLAQLAAASGVSDRGISDLERAVSRHPRARTVEALADGLGLTGGDRSVLLSAAQPGAGTVAVGGLPLPRPVPDFVGRGAELDRIAAWTRQSPAPAVVICGPPGVGKTALAVRAARARHADRYVFIDLHGLDVTPPAAAGVLGRLLRAVDPGIRAVPDDGDEAAALWQDRIRDLRCVVVLDNAASESQVRPILPPPGPAFVLVTARRALSGLDRVRRWRLDALPADDATALLATILEDHGTTQGEALRELARLCDNVPLALRIAGNRLLSRPGWTPQDLIDRLSVPDRRLDTLVAGDLQLKAAFKLSYRQASNAARRLLHRLAAEEGSLEPAPPGTAGRELIELSLLRPRPDGRWELPGLLRLYAGTERLPVETNFVSSSWRGGPPW